MCQHLHSRGFSGSTCPPHLPPLHESSAKETAPSHKLKWSCPVRFSREWGRPRGRVGCLLRRLGTVPGETHLFNNLSAAFKGGQALRDHGSWQKECLRFQQAALYPFRNHRLYFHQRDYFCLQAEATIISSLEEFCPGLRV